MVTSAGEGQAGNAPRDDLRAAELPCEVPRTVPPPTLRRIWTALRRDAASRDSGSLEQIETWKWPFWGEAPHTVPVHVVAGEADWREAAWMLASWFCASDLAWPVVLHDDGTLSEKARNFFRRAFGDVLRIIDRVEADAELVPRLKEFPFCEEFRAKHAAALKLFDTAHFAATDRYLVFDSDVLFFQKPREIREWADGESQDCWFAEDAQENSIITVAEARDELDVKLWRRVDAGISLLWKPAIDLDFCDLTLAQTSILKGSPERIAGTLLALCASRHGTGGLLPKTYETSVEKNAAADAVARHYIGAVRDRFSTEGVSRLRETVLKIGED